MRVALARAHGLSPDPVLLLDLETAFGAMSPTEIADLPRLLEASGLGALAVDDLPQMLPARERAAAADLAARTRERGERLEEDRARLATAFATAGLAFHPLKGAWLAPVAYAAPELRPMADTDLFVEPERLGAVSAVMLELGYEPIARTWKHTTWLRPDNRRVVDPRGEHPDNPRPVEIHPQLGERFRGIGLSIPAELPIARGVHLVAHAGVDVLSRRLRPISLVDVALWSALLDEEQWLELSAWGATQATARFLWPALALAERELGLRLPSVPMQRLAAKASPALRSWLGSVDVAAVGREARDTAPRALFEIARIWPIGAGEQARVLRSQLLPGRWQLADRDPDLAAGPWWPLALALHVAGLPRLLLRRWRQRG